MGAAPAVGSTGGARAVGGGTHPKKHCVTQRKGAGEINKSNTGCRAAADAGANTNSRRIKRKSGRGGGGQFGVKDTHMHLAKKYMCTGDLERDTREAREHGTHEDATLFYSQCPRPRGR